MYVLIFFCGFEGNELRRIFGNFNGPEDEDLREYLKDFQKFDEYEWRKGSVRACLVEMGTRPDLQEYVDSL